MAQSGDFLGVGVAAGGTGMSLAAGGGAIRIHSDGLISMLAGGGDHFGVGITAGAGVSDRTGCCAGCVNGSGFVSMLAGGGDHFGIGIVAVCTGVDLAAGLAAGGCGFNTSVGMADSGDYFHGLLTADGAGGGDGAVGGAGSFHSDGFVFMGAGNGYGNSTQNLVLAGDGTDISTGGLAVKGGVPGYHIRGNGKGCGIGIHTVSTGLNRQLAQNGVQRGCFRDGVFLRGGTCQANVVSADGRTGTCVLIQTHGIGAAGACLEIVVAVAPTHIILGAAAPPAGAAAGLGDGVLTVAAAGNGPGAAGVAGCQLGAAAAQVSAVLFDGIGIAGGGEGPAVGGISGGIVAIDGYAYGIAAACSCVQSLCVALCNDQILGAVVDAVSIQNIGVACGQCDPFVFGGGNIGSFGLGRSFGDIGSLGLGGSFGSGGTTLCQLVQTDIRSGAAAVLCPAGAVIVEIVSAIAAACADNTQAEAVGAGANIEGAVTAAAEVPTGAGVTQLVAVCAGNGAAGSAGEGPLSQLFFGSQSVTGDGYIHAAQRTAIVHQGDRVVLTYDDIALTGLNLGNQLISTFLGGLLCNIVGTEVVGGEGDGTVHDLGLGFGALFGIDQQNCLGSIKLVGIVQSDGDSSALTLGIAFRCDVIGSVSTVGCAVIAGGTVGAEQLGSGQTGQTGRGNRNIVVGYGEGGLGLTQLNDGTLGTDHVAVGVKTADSSTGGLQLMCTVGSITLNGHLITGDLKSGHGLMGAGAAGDLAQVAVVHVSEADAGVGIFAGGTFHHGKAAALGQVERTITQILVVTAGVVMAYQVDNVQTSFACCFKLIEDQFCVAVVATGGSVQGQVRGNKDRFGVAFCHLGVQIIAQSVGSALYQSLAGRRIGTGCPGEVIVVDGIDTVVCGIMGTALVHQVGAVNFQTGIVFVVTLNIDAVFRRNLGKYAADDVIHSLNMGSFCVDAAGIVVAAQQSAVSSAVVVLDMIHDIRHDRAGVAQLIVRSRNDHDGVCGCECTDRQDADEHYQNQNCR